MKKKQFVSGIAVIMTMTALFGCSVPGASSSVSDSSSSIAQATLSLSKKNLDLTLFDSFTLHATLTGSSETVVFVSSDENVASVSPTGEVKGLKAGTATITASAAGVSDTCLVSVTYGDVKPVLALNHETIDLFKAGTITLAATVSFNGNEVTPDSLTWRADQEGIVALSENGSSCLVSAQNYGQTNVIARMVFAGTTIEKQCTVLVKEDVSIEIQDGTLVEGQYTSNLITYKPEGYDGGLETSYRPTIVVTKDEQTLTNPALAISLQAGSEEGVVAYADGTFSALKKGIAVFDLQYEGASLKLFSVSLKITVSGPSIALDGSYDIDLHSNSALITDAKIQGDPLSAKIDGMDVLASREGDAIKLEGLSSLHFGIGKTMEIVTTKGSYSSSNVTLASMIISSKDELDSLGAVAKAAYSVTDYPDFPSGWDGYYIFDQDIDYEGTFTPFAGTNEGATFWGDGFQGTIDGRGHYIKGLTIASPSGVFGIVSLRSTIKNLGFTDALLTSHGGYLSQLMYGTVENVYIKGKVLADPNGFVGALCSEFLNPASLKNVVIELDNGGSYGWGGVSGIGYVTSVGTISDTYLIGADNTRFTYSEASRGDEAMALAAQANEAKFASRGAFLESGVSVASFSPTYWDTATGFPLWRTAKEQIQGNIILTASHDFDLSQGVAEYSDPLIKGTVNQVVLDGVDCSFTLTDNVIGINLSGISSTGDAKKLLIKTDAAVYECDSISLVSKIISSKADFDQMGTIAKLAYVGDKYPSTIGGSAGYFVLGNDIDYNATFASWCGTSEGATYWGDGWHGVFDGRGHAIKGLTVASNSGIFGVASIYSEIKNVAFKDSVLATVGGYLTQLSYGKVTNVSIDLHTGGGSGFVGAFAGEFMAGSVYNNVIARLDSTSAFGWGGVGGFGITRGTGAVSNTYLIVSGANFTYQESPDLAEFVNGLNACHYGDEAAFKAASLDFSSFPSTYWDVSSGTPHFIG